MTFERVWIRIVEHSGEVFHQKRGNEFTYDIVGNVVVPDRTNRQLSRSQFEQAWRRLPVDGPGAFQDLQGPSYLWAVLTDPRITGRS